MTSLQLAQLAKLHYFKETDMALGDGKFAGPEAEGHLKGIRTLFVKDGIVEQTHGYPHLFFTKEYKDWEHVCSHLDIGEALVTVETFEGEVENIPYEILTRAHIMVRVHLRDIHLLKPTDTIVVGLPYDCYSYQLGVGIRSTLSDYSLDEII